MGDISRKLLAEALGTALLLAVVIGSGIMAERLSGGNVAIALLANTLATVGGLYILIEVFGPGQRRALQSRRVARDGRARRAAGRLLAPYVVAQLVGAVLGAWLAHAMFDVTILQFSTKVRTGTGQWIAEARRHRGPAAGHPARAAGPRRGDGRRLHRRGLLVHRLDLVRQPRGGVRPDVQRQLRRHRARRACRASWSLNSSARPSACHSRIAPDRGPAAAAAGLEAAIVQRTCTLLPSRHD